MGGVRLSESEESKKQNEAAVCHGTQELRVPQGGSFGSILYAVEV